MNIKDQVLSIEQIQELQELGFDVEKYSSLKSNGKQIITKDDFYIGGAPLFPTLTIGDIIDILPHHKFLLEKGYEDTNMYHLEHKFSSLEGIKILQHESGSFLRLLFDNLKWCIINKHIES